MKLRMMTIVGALAALALTGTAYAQDAQDHADQAKDSAQQSWNDAKQGAQQGYDATKQKTEQGYDSAKQSAQQGYGTAKEKTEEGYDTAKQKTEQGYDSAKESAQQGYGSAKEKLSAADRAATRSHTLHGKVTRVDDKSLTIQDSRGKEVSLNRDAHTRISSASGQNASDQLQEGSEVRANFRVDDKGDKWARSIVITAKPSANAQDRDQDHDQDRDQAK